MPIWGLLLCVMFLTPLNTSAGDAPNFSLRNVRNGEYISLSSYWGKVILLDFFAVWCEPCKITIPILQETNAAFTSEFQIISIHESGQGQESDSVINDFINVEGMNWVVVNDESNSVGLSYGVNPIPAFFLIDQSGTIQKYHVGSNISADDLIDDITTLLGNGNLNSPQDKENFPTALIGGAILVGGVGIGVLWMIISKQSQQISSTELNQRMVVQREKEKRARTQILENIGKRTNNSAASEINTKKRPRKRRR